MQLRHITSVLKSFLRGRAGGLIPVSYRTLVQILAHLNPEDGEWACPIDVPGCRLQWDASSLNRTGGTGAWVGHLGVLTSAQYALLDLSRTSNALTWSTPSGDVKFGGAVIGRHYGAVNPGPWAIAGDSIMFNAGSSAEVAMNTLGIPYSQTRFASPGKRINEQTPVLAAIAAEGIRNVICQVGSNDVIQARTLAQIYSDYRDYMREAARLGINLHMIYISPLVSTYGDKVWLSNVAMYRAAQEFGAATHEVWMEYSALAGGWAGGAADTAGGDNTHPVLSRRVAAGGRLANRLKYGGQNDLPLPRATADGLHPNPCFTGAGPVATSWGAYLTPAGTTRSVEAYGANGHQWQVITMVNPGNGAAAGVNYYGSKAGMGFADGDRMAVMLAAEMTANVDETAYDGCGDMALQVQASGGAAPLITSGVRLASGERQIWWEYTIPVGCTVADMALYIRGRNYATTGTISLRLRNCNVINLTQNGLA